MLSDSNDEFAADMRAALSHSVADVTGTLDLAVLRKRYARRVTARRAGMVAAPLALAVVVGSVAVAPDLGRTQPAPSAHGSGVVTPVLDVAYVTAHVNDAMRNASHDVTYVKFAPIMPAGHSQLFEFWVAADGSAVRKRLTMDGNVVSDEAFRPSDILTVSYPSKTYSRTPTTGQPAYTPSGGNTVGFPLPQEIKQAVDGGTLKIVGNEVINGQPTIHLLVEGAVPGFAGHQFTDLWVSQSSYLPIRIKFGSHQQDYTWLPPTSQNLALLNAPIPPGFREVN